ncbi:MAG TPA: hypothetical protein VGX03_22050, partial [Candidatus Binatia bacterium]|nr:hypothetical protein [Candidatus Binatia bacterium]
LLAQHAPTWLVQMPALLNAAELETLQRKVAGATKERMLRELAEALEALTSERPVILWLEDLHWGDYSTLDWLAFVARRQERTQLLMLGTYRPVEVLTREHPLKAVKQELQVHGHCQELAVDFLTEAAVAEYLKRRFPSRDRQGAEGRSLADARGSEEAAAWRRLAQLIHQRTDGNPLFMVNVVDTLITQEVVTPSGDQWALRDGVEQVVAGIPKNLRQMIEQRLERASPAERTLLQIASVAGVEFSAATVAAGAETTLEAVEEQCAELARRESFLQVRGTADWPDRTVATRYGFLHALYQEVLYERLPAGQRQRLHQRIGEREEQAYGERAREIAAELAVHFEQGRDYRKAVQYLQQAGENAVRRSAHREAISHLSKGLELLKTLPDTLERARRELVLQTTLGAVLVTIKGFAAPDLERAYARARELCQQLGETPQLFPVLWGVFRFHLGRAEWQTARPLAEQLLRLAQSVQDPALLLEAHRGLAATLVPLGEFVSALAHAEQGIALYDPRQHRSHASLYGGDPGVVCRHWAAVTLWYLGYPDQARKRIHEALTLAQELSHPFSLAWALTSAANINRLLGDVQAAQEWTEALLTLAREQGFAHWLADGAMRRGWVLAEQGQVEEGIAQMQQGLAALRAMGTAVDRANNLALLAEVYGKAGQTEEGLSVLAEALDLVQKTGGRSEAELYRLKGQLTLQSKVSSPKSQVEEAEACFCKAIEIARRQQAKSLELRAVMSLSRLWQQQGKKDKARQMLAEIYSWFTEGFDTKDLQEAKALLKELA